MPETKPDFPLIRLNELFWSIQGEGIYAGRTAVFIRLQGCPVGCSWCDSKSTWYNGGESITLYELALRVNALPASDLIVVTGGEPLIHDLDPLFGHCRTLWPERTITLETSGAYPFKGELRPDFVTLSPKAAARWEVDDTVSDALDRASGEIKLVVDRDLTEGVIQEFSAYADELAAPLVLMPEGSPPSDENVSRTVALLRRAPFARFGPRLQYAYGAIGKMEGKNNEIISPMEAKARARESRTGSREVLPGAPAPSLLRSAAIDMTQRLTGHLLDGARRADLDKTIAAPAQPEAPIHILAGDKHRWELDFAAGRLVHIDENDNRTIVAQAGYDPGAPTSAVRSAEPAPYDRAAAEDAAPAGTTLFEMFNTPIPAAQPVSIAPAPAAVEPDDPYWDEAGKVGQSHPADAEV